jgi:hypothetical protein
VCIECHRTLEATQGDAIERIRNEEIDCSHKQEVEKYKAKYEKMAKERDKESNHHSNTLTAVEKLIEKQIKINLHIVHETRYSTSRVLYIGTDRQKAVECYKDSDRHVTMETASVNIDDWFDELADGQVQEIVGNTRLRPMLEENGSVDVVKHD